MQCLPVSPANCWRYQPPLPPLHCCNVVNTLGLQREAVNQPQALLDCNDGCGGFDDVGARQIKLRSRTTPRRSRALHTTSYARAISPLRRTR